MENNMNYFLQGKMPFGKALFMCFILGVLILNSAHGQNLSVSGRVVDSNGESLIGVSVVVKGVTNGTITDIDGRYNVMVPSEKAVLEFSYVGFRTLNEALKGRKVINVTLSEDIQGLDEVIVIGYGVSKKSDLTGSVASVKAEDLAKFPASNVTDMLRGQAAGIQVTLNSAAPGGKSDVLIRGKRSLSGSQSPLYLVDGMVVPHIDDLNSNDISSIEVLKDASSQAIYGSRAANGVILITTKKGGKEKISVDVNSYVGFQKFHRNFDLYSPEEWVTLRYWAKHNSGTPNLGTLDKMNMEVVMDDPVMLAAYQSGKITDWEDLLLVPYLLN